MPENAPPRIANDNPIGPDIDLDGEDIRLADGSRLTNVVANEIVEKLRQLPGRPSLSGKATVSPRIAFRVSASVRDRAAQVAAREGKTISQVAREALEARVGNV